MVKRLMIAAVLMAALGGCCVIDENVVVLLADPDGTVGRVVVQNPQGSQTLSGVRQATRIESAQAAPTAPAPMDEYDILRVFGMALAAQPSPPVKFRLYFRSGTAELTPESRALLPQIALMVRQRRSVDVSVVGHTDTVGSAALNYRLSKKRAEAVAGLLERLRVDRRILEIESHGKGNLLVPTADNVAEPRNRRVEVTVR